MHLDRENIFAVGLDQRRPMIRRLFVELERLWSCNHDSPHRPIDQQALVFGAIESSGDVVK